MIVGCHQTSFFPYYGFFQKMMLCDKFVLMTNCQFEKGNYQNRFNIGETWYTMSVNSGLDLIKNKKYVNKEADWNRIKTNLSGFNLSQFDGCITNSLADTNISIIRRLQKILGIKTEVVLDYPTKLKSTARLVDICKKHKATVYLSGMSGVNYLDYDLFIKEGIDIEHQKSIINKPIVEFLK